MQTDNWTYPEFHAFVMLYAANTDGHITTEEEALIAPTITSDAYAKIKSVFMACDDSEALDIIFSYRDQYCSTEEDKSRILTDMMAIYQSHDKLGQVEREVYHLFQKCL
ncbi:MAG TPA: hypothetical protein VK168_18745 [Saprospiraceae bacterium]|nr:hypothetical protein [Saprospiraceae bacterium]